MGVCRLRFLIFFFVILQRGFCDIASEKKERANLPPRGWNSYDSFDWVINEQEFLDNAKVVAEKLKSYGYEYVVVDYLWYRRTGSGASPWSGGLDVIDEWGRLKPHPERWPSSLQGNGFKKVAKIVHDMGLKFGIHVMRGISVQAYDANTPILDPSTGVAFKDNGKVWRAKDIGLDNMRCKWMSNAFMSVNTDLAAGKAFLKSLYQQYAEWGVDFVKNDCVFGDDLDVKEIKTVSEILKELDRPIVYSLSPGTVVTPNMAKEVSSYVNMYRITADDWDKWNDVRYHFDVARDFAAASMIGAEGLDGKSWPDMDMLPLGWLTDPGMSRGPHRKCNLTLPEQKTQLTLWSMAKSPLMYGGDLRNIDNTTLELITNPVLLEINYFSLNNMEISHLISTNDMVSSSKSRGVEHENSSLKHALRLTSCKDSEAKTWVSGNSDGDLDKICLKDSFGRNNESPFCLNKKLPSIKMDEESTQKFHFLGIDLMESCLETSTNRKFTSSELEIRSSAPCKWNANQMWKLNDDGAIVNSYSNLCAKMESTTDDATNGVRTWTAVGRKDKIYVAFFNLASETRVIAVPIRDFANALSMQFKSCRGSEIWSGVSVNRGDPMLTATVESHGAALFNLNCD